MDTHSIGFTIFLVFTGAALFARQSLLVAYILLGILLGPWGLRLVDDPDSASCSCCFSSGSTCNHRICCTWCARQRW